MISTLISLYAAGSLLGNDIQSTTAHTIPLQSNVQLETTQVPQKNPINISPVIKADAAIAIDLKNSVILYEKNIHEALPIASLTKLMTAVVILEENNIKDEVTISRLATKTPGSTIWLAPGENISVEKLLLASLINSANDAASALAEYSGKNIDNFVDKMNLKSKEIGLLSTHFINPTGLDEELDPNDPRMEELVENGHTTEIISNISTAYDLALLGKYAYGKSFIRRAATKKELEITSTNENLKHKLKNTNELLDSYLRVLGLKTGTTDTAGECLIAIIENDQGNKILTVVLNSPNRYTETKVLTDWVYRTYTWS